MLPLYNIVQAYSVQKLSKNGLWSNYVYKEIHTKHFG